MISRRTGETVGMLEEPEINYPDYPLQPEQQIPLAF
jgi:hypothetical protein